MYCPQCSQQQVDDNVRFCSRCGFPLGGVSDLLAQGGVLPVSDAGGSTRRRSPRREGVRQGTLMILIGMVLVPLVAVFSTLVLDRPELFVPPVAIICFVGGLMRILYALIFQEGAPKRLNVDATAYVPPPMPARLSAPARGSALPPAQSTPATGWRGRMDTSELVQPPSVTENTTRLLNDQTDEQPREKR
jgi:hypothetical protein